MRAYLRWTLNRCSAAHGIRLKTVSTSSPAHGRKTHIELHLSDREHILLTNRMVTNEGAVKPSTFARTGSRPAVPWMEWTTHSRPSTSTSGPAATPGRTARVTLPLMVLVLSQHSRQVSGSGMFSCRSGSIGISFIGRLSIRRTSPFTTGGFMGLFCGLEIRCGWQIVRLGLC